MVKYKIIFYETENGKIPVDEFIYTLTDKHIAKIFWEFDILEELGRNLKAPYCDYLKDGVWELRIKFAGDISRIFYFFFQRTDIILTNGFIKKTQKTPKDELEKAIRYKKDYERRSKK